MAFTLPALPYAHDALEPHIDARTMEIHHGKHHQAYVDNLNKALEGKGISEQSIEDLCRNIEKIPADIRTAVRNNGGGHANHSMFWTLMSPKGGGKPAGDVAKAIDSRARHSITPAALLRLAVRRALARQHFRRRRRSVLSAAGVVIRCTSQV